MRVVAGSSTAHLSSRNIDCTLFLIMLYLYYLYVGKTTAEIAGKLTVNPNSRDVGCTLFK